MKTVVSCLVTLTLALLFLNDATAQIMPLRLANKGPSRTWKSADGGFSTDARLLGYNEKGAILERADGREITVPLEKLSEDDRRYLIEYIAKETAKPEDKPATPPPPATSLDPSAPFDAKAVVKAWSAPDEPLKLTPVASWKFDKLPDHFELSENGEFVHAAYYADARHLVYRAQDGVLLHTIDFGVAPLTAAAISPNGKAIVATIGKDGAGVYDIEQKKQRFAHNVMVNVTKLKVVGEKKPRVWGSFPAGGVANYPLFGGFGGRLEDPPLPKKAADNAVTEMAVATDGRFAFYRVPEDPTKLYAVTFNSWGIFSGSVQIPVDMTGGSQLAMGNRILAFTGVPDAMVLLRFPDDLEKNFTQKALSFRSTLDRQVFVAPDDSACAFYYPDRGHLTMMSLPSGGVKRVGFPRAAKPKWLQLCWKNNSLATCTADGQVQVATMSGHRSHLHLISADVHSWIAGKQDERLEQVAAELEQEGNFSFAPRMNKYLLLDNMLSPGEFLENPAWTKQVDEWAARNKTSRLVRYRQGSKLIGEAWAARGGEFAINVTPEQWKGFREKLDEAEPVVLSFDREPTIPGLAYMNIFALAMGQQWEPDREEKYVARLLKEAPRCMEAHLARAVGLQPRWGGKDTDCRDYAERVAKEIGGPDGEAMYALIAYGLHKFNGPAIFTELKFHSARVHAGLAQYFRDNLDSPYYHQMGLLMGALANDGAVIIPYAKAMIETNEPHLPDVIEEDIYQQLAKGMLNR